MPDADLAEVVDEAVTVLLAKLEGRRFGTTDKPRKTLAETDTSASSRYVPAAVRRVVFERDQGRCAYVDDATGRRCSCTDSGQLEFHHLTPFARGCDHDPDRIELRCRSHNVYQGELDFGPETMKRYRKGSSRAREPQAAYGPRTRAPASEQRLVRSRQVESPKREPPKARRRRSPLWKRRVSPTREALRAPCPVARDRPPGPLHWADASLAARRAASGPARLLSLLDRWRGGASCGVHATWGSAPDAPQDRSLAD